MTLTTQAVREMAEMLRGHVNARGGSSLENGFWQRAIDASDMLLALVEERDMLAEANAKKADDIVTLGQLVGKAEARAEAAEAALLDAQKRLRGAGMLGGDNDPVNVARRALEAAMEARK